MNNLEYKSPKHSPVTTRPKSLLPLPSSLPGLIGPPKLASGQVQLATWIGPSPHSWHELKGDQVTADAYCLRWGTGQAWCSMVSTQGVLACMCLKYIFKVLDRICEDLVTPLVWDWIYEAWLDNLWAPNPLTLIRYIGILIRIEYIFHVELSSKLNVIRDRPPT